MAAKSTSERGAILTPVDFVPLGDGTFRAVPRKPVELASVALAARMTGVRKDAIYKLYHAGFIRGTQASPRKLLIIMATLTQHLEDAADPEFWTRARHTRYMEAAVLRF